jgi:hypothetical protein
MAATSLQSSQKASGVDELLFQNDTVSLCLLVNRRHGSLRIIDFRAGATLAKRNFVLAAAKRERVEKVFTLVERDEVTTWTRLGFQREGNIPGFYKRSDAWILGAVVSEAKPMNGAIPGDPDEDDDDLSPEEPGSVASALAERTLAKAKRVLKNMTAKSMPAMKIAKVREADAKKAVLAATREGRAITGFEPFGRDVQRTVHVVTGRSGFELYASWESQACFGNSFLEILSGPGEEEDRTMYIGALRTLCDRLVQEGAVNTFCLAPADDVALSAIFLSAGFRRSAVLASHLVVGGVRRDAILWSKKLLTPEG